ncbi:hypothetical protein FMUND_14329 [Fusarium mundagurra]|uniref:Uncharacterized protein n=1 Tax=Fusarium mundagurra TaxID=1567541 RepID=A0A8H5XVR6_9HYPO|nr:hypothetical protein FMUND_14329 [Fusarium mundagurra]
MKLGTFSGLAWLMLAHGGLPTASFETCSALEATTCTCPTVKKCAPLQYNYPEDHFPRDGDTCSNSAPACCAERGDGPLRVTAADNLQCGKDAFDPEEGSDVMDGITYTVEPCKTDPSNQCLHVVLNPTDAVKDIHLAIDDIPIENPGGPGQWDFNDYCTKSPSECWVPVSDIIDTFDPKPASLCGKKIYIAPHIEITSDSCTAQGTKIPSNNNNWFMYSDLTFECAADACLRKCCCPTPALQ